MTIHSRLQGLWSFGAQVCDVPVARLVALGVLVLWGYANPLQALSFTVNVTGSGCTDANVLAIALGTQGPDHVKSRATTASNGTAIFSDLADSTDYQFVATKSGCSPSMRDQAMNPDNRPTRPTTGGSKAIALTSGASGGTVTINLTLPSGTFPTLVMAHCQHGTNAEPVAFSMASIAGATGGSISIVNVPVSAANTLHCGVFAPRDNRGSGTSIGAVTNGGTTTASLDLTNSFAPPPAAEGRTVQGGGAALAILVTKASDGSAVSGAQCKVKTSPTGAPNGFSMTDSQGVCQFFAPPLQNGVTAYLDILAMGLQGVNNREFFSTDWSTLSKSSSVALSVPTGGVTLSGTVKIGSTVVPNVWINLRQDFQTRQGTDQFAGTNPGSSFANTVSETGSFSLTNIQPGNYALEVNTPFSNQPTMFSNGADGQLGTADDRRLTVTASTFQVYTTTGGLVSSGGSLDVSVLVDPSAANGKISGTLTFPENADLRTSPILIVAYEEGAFGHTPGQRPKSGFASVSGVGSTQTYEMNLPAGTRYFIHVKGNNSYGPIEMGPNSFADLTGGRTAITGLNFRMAKAGTLEVTAVLKASGLRFLPTRTPAPGQTGDFASSFCSGRINAMGLNVPSFVGGEIDNDGVAVLRGVVAGDYRVMFESSGAGCTIANTHLEPVTIADGVTTKVRLYLSPGVRLEAKHTGDLPVGTGVPRPCVPGSSECPTQIARIVGFKAGTALTFDNLSMMHGKRGESAPILMMQREFRNPSGQTVVSWGGFGGPDQSLKVVAALYDFYLFSEGFPSFSPGKDPGSFYLTVLGRKKAALVDETQYVRSEVFSSSTVVVSLPSSPGTATLSGAIKATRLFTKDDIRGMGREFDKFLGYVPICTVYDSSSSFLGLGMGMPTEFRPEIEGKMEEELERNDVDGFLTHATSVTLRYAIKHLPAGSHTAVCTTPNYPPVVTKVVLTAGGTTTNDVDFDKAVGLGATLSGAVTDTAGTRLSGASVTIKTRAGFKKTVTADANGEYAIIALADGRYHLQVSHPGYAMETDRVTIESTSSTTKIISLTAAPGSIQTTVYASFFPNRKVASDIECIAHDATAAAIKLDAEPPHIKTKTNELGVCRIPNPFPGHVYKLCAVDEGKTVICTSATATTGNLTANDILLSARPPVPILSFRPAEGASQGVMDLLLTLTKTAIETPSVQCSAGATFTDSGATAVSLVVGPNNTYKAEKVTLPSTTGDNTCRAIMKDGAKQQTTGVVINATHKAKATSAVDKASAIGGGAFADSGDESAGAVFFGIGSTVIQEGAVPICEVVRGATSTISVPKTTMTVVSDPVEVTLGSAAQIATGRSLELALPIDKSKVVDCKSLKLAQVIGSEVKEVSTKGYCDPVSGQYIVDIKSIVDAPAAVLIQYADSRPGLKGLAPYVKGQYVYSAAAAADQTGKFILISGVSTQGSAYSGTSLNAYNFPNPFNLKSKTLTLASGGVTSSLETQGTILRYDLPSANGGKVIIRIYTLAGELVRVLDDGTKDGGFTYYTTWDGKNKDGESVASGVYFAVFDVPGKKPKDHTIKMAVLK